MPPLYRELLYEIVNYPPLKTSLCGARLGRVQRSWWAIKTLISGERNSVTTDSVAEEQVRRMRENWSRH